MTLHDISSPEDVISYLGYNVIGGSTATGTASHLTYILKKITTPTYPVLAISLDLYMKGNGSNVGSFYGGIQSDSAGSPGGDIVCQGNFAGNGTGGGIVINFLSSATPSWKSIPMGCILLPNTSYWLRAVYGGSSTAAATNIYYDTGTDNTGQDDNTWFNPGAAGTNSSRNHSLRLAVMKVANV